MKSFELTQDELMRAAKEKPAMMIKALLTLRNISQLDLAKKFSISPSEISKVITGRRKTFRIRYLIAKELDVEVETLFAALDEPAEKREDGDRSFYRINELS